MSFYVGEKKYGMTTSDVYAHQVKPEECENCCYFVAGTYCYPPKSTSSKVYQLFQYTITGAAIGAGIGALVAPGVGAPPGAIAGAAVGFVVGSVKLASQN